MSTPVPIEKIYPDPRNIRAELEGIEELANSLRVVGLLQPLVVRPRPGGGYTIVDGHRRYAAAVAAGVPALHCLMGRKSRDGNGAETLVMLAAAMHQQLTPLEAGRAFEKLTRRGMSPGDIAEATGYSMRTVRDRLALVALPREVQQMLADGQISTKDATVLAREVKATGSGSTTKRAPKPAHFNPGHPLYASVRKACTHRSERAVVGGAGCGQCWEIAIRDDEAHELSTFTKEHQ